MSSGTMQDRGQGTDQQISKQREQQVEHTEPTPDELAAQARITRPLIAVDRDGNAYDCRYVEDGYAFRPFGITDDAAWGWQRSRDFEGRCRVFAEYNPQPTLDALATVTLEASRLRRQLRVALSAMGQKSRDRLSSMMVPPDITSIYAISVDETENNSGRSGKRKKNRNNS